MSMEAHASWSMVLNLLVTKREPIIRDTVAVGVGISEGCDHHNGDGGSNRNISS